MKAKKFLFIGVLAFLGLAGCGVDTEAKYSDKEHEKMYEHGSLISDEGGLSVLGGDEDKKTQDQASGLGVNGFLWRATLDTVSFMPIASADPFGGVIITDWYTAPDTPDERVKLNVFILDRELRADGVRVSVFRQTKGTKGEWADAAVAPNTSTSLENTILTRARQIKLAQKEFH